MVVVVRGAFVSRLRLSSILLNRRETHGLKRERFFGGKAGKPWRGP